MSGAGRPQGGYFMNLIIIILSLEKILGLCFFCGSPPIFNEINQFLGGNDFVQENFAFRPHAPFCLFF